MKNHNGIKKTDKEILNPICRIFHFLNMEKGEKGSKGEIAEIQPLFSNVIDDNAEIERSNEQE